jgi:hypothetical protein
MNRIRNFRFAIFDFRFMAAARKSEIKNRKSKILPILSIHVN